MRTQHKRHGLASTVSRRPLHRRELRRESCEDVGGNRFTVIAWRPYAGLRITHYELEDGTPVRVIDDCLFEIETTGQTLSRCDE